MTFTHDPIAVPYAGLGLDRAADRRRDVAWMAAAVADPRARIRPMWRDRCLVAGDPPLPVNGVADLEDPGLVLLGIDDDGPLFAVDLSDLELDEALNAAGAREAVDIRSVFAQVSAADACGLAYARGLLHWHRHQRHCGCCGAPTGSRDAGHQRACTDPACGELLFPRIEPAVITLVETAAAPNRCLLARHRASTAGGYSLLAGFVEIGESLEDAARREIREETGVVLGRVEYVASQPWPFPAGLMVAFRAVATDEAVVVDEEEIAEARWFTREEVREYEAARGALGRPDSIDRLMLSAWIAEER